METKTAKHTPGPLQQLLEAAKRVEQAVDIGAADVPAAIGIQLGRAIDRAEKYRLLLEAMPDLLSAAKKALEWHDDPIGLPSPSTDLFNAIAKAEGR